MANYPIPYSLAFPVEPYALPEGYYRFGTRVRSRILLWAHHLGDDIVVPAGAPVAAIGEGEVVWAGVRAGREAARNWGGLVVLAHQTQNAKLKTQNFFSVYGHMKNLRVKVGEGVQMGQIIGEVGEALTPENGWWKIPHLHFAIYVGPWTGEILPGYKRPFDGRTKLTWWRDPRPFIEAYNKN